MLKTKDLNKDWQLWT